MANEYKCRTVRVDSLEKFKVLARISRKPYASFYSLLVIAIYLYIVSESKVFPIALVLGCLFMTYSVIRCFYYRTMVEVRKELK